MGFWRTLRIGCRHDSDADCLANRLIGHVPGGLRGPDPEVRCGHRNCLQHISGKSDAELWPTPPTTEPATAGD